jgi:hypothetical protein
MKPKKTKAPKNTFPKLTARQRAVDDAFCFAINMDQGSVPKLVTLYNILIQGAAECVETFNAQHDWSAAKANRFHRSEALANLDSALQYAAIPTGTPIT